MIKRLAVETRDVANPEIGILERGPLSREAGRESGLFTRRRLFYPRTKWETSSSVRLKAEGKLRGHSGTTSEASSGTILRPLVRSKPHRNEYAVLKQLQRAQCASRLTTIDGSAMDSQAVRQ